MPRSLVTLQPTDKEAQSRRTRSGRRFEKNLHYIINHILNPHDIYARSIPELRRAAKVDPELNRIYEYAKLPFQHPCDQNYQMILPETDLMIFSLKKDHEGTVTTRILLATLSSKVSLHGRETESLFWAKALANHPGRFLFATEDSDAELGTCGKPKRARRLLESIMHRTYLANTYPTTDEPELEQDISKFFESFRKSEASGFQTQETRVFDNKRIEGMSLRKAKTFG